LCCSGGADGSDGAPSGGLAARLAEREALSFCCIVAAA
jgi:hypothetical protein